MNVRKALGWLSFILALCFWVGLFWGLNRAAWSSHSKDGGPIAFLGFGIPMVLLGGVAFVLWSDSKVLTKVLGWTSTLIGLVSTLSMLALVAEWTRLVNFSTRGDGFEATFAFGGLLLTMLVVGGVGVFILTNSERRRS